MAPSNRLDVLAQRVRVVDRHRRVLSIAVALVLCGLLSRKVAALFGMEWPSVFLLVVLAPFLGLVWWLVEAGFAWVIALWETEHDRIARDCGLPRAQLLRRRRRRE